MNTALVSMKLHYMNIVTVDQILKHFLHFYVVLQVNKHPFY